MKLTPDQCRTIDAACDTFRAVGIQPPRVGEVAVDRLMITRETAEFIAGRQTEHKQAGRSFPDPLARRSHQTLSGSLAVPLLYVLYAVSMLAVFAVFWMSPDLSKKQNVSLTVSLCGLFLLSLYKDVFKPRFRGVSVVVSAWFRSLFLTVSVLRGAFALWCLVSLQPAVAINGADKRQLSLAVWNAIVAKVAWKAMLAGVTGRLKPQGLAGAAVRLARRQFALRTAEGS